MTVREKGRPVADLTAEAHLLGAMMYDPKHLSAVPTSLTAESFYSGAHRRIYETIVDLRDERTDVNVTTVAARLRSQGRMPEITDGAATLNKYVDETPILTPSSFESLVAIVVGKAMQRSMQLILARATARFDDPSVDVSKELTELEHEVQNVSLRTPDSGGLQHVKVALQAEIAEWANRQNGTGNPGISTGFRDLDAQTGGWHRGELVVIAARPGMGKTSLVTGACVNVAKRGHSTAIFSLEMPARQLAARMLCVEAGLPLMRTRAGVLDQDEMRSATHALGELRDLGIFVDDASRGRLYVADIVARSRRLAAELAKKGQKLALIVVDYIQIVKLRADLQRQRHDLAVGEVSMELKALAKDLDCTVIGLAQLSRSVEQRTDKRPGLSDLRDSGQIEQDADAVMMLYRDEYYDPDTRDKGVVEIIIEKQRSGPTGTVKLRFYGPTTKFLDLPEGQQ